MRNITMLLQYMYTTYCVGTESLWACLDDDIHGVECKRHCLKFSLDFAL